MTWKTSPRERANKLVTTGADILLSFGLGNPGKFGSFCQRHIQSATAVGFTLSHDKKKVKFAFSPAQPIHRRKGEKCSCSSVEYILVFILFTILTEFSLCTRHSTGVGDAAVTRNTSFCHLGAYLLVGERLIINKTSKFFLKL